LKKLLEEKAIGDLVSVQHLEPVGYWHQAHSFVRGNWRNEAESSFMLLAKCCHDLDLIQHYAGSKSKAISSYGQLNFFKKENAPEGCSDRCSTCIHKDTCLYSAYRLYVQRWKDYGALPDVWPQNVITSDVPLTEEKIVKAIETTPYGRCVFHSDNNVVDTQTTNILFENGVTANLLMTGFTYHGGRHYIFHGTHGEIDFDEAHDTISILKFGEEPQILPFDSLVDINGGHGGGDRGIIDSIYEYFCGIYTGNAISEIDISVNNHLLVFAAEESRKSGAVVDFDHFLDQHRV
jgi:predicted dehydrogenase